MAQAAAVFKQLPSLAQAAAAIASGCDCDAGCAKCLIQHGCRDGNMALLEQLGLVLAVLDTYAKPYNPDCPVICMDEQPVQLQRETRTPIPATAKHGKRVDYEYERAGTASIFMFTEPLAGWREVSVRPRRTKVDWATEIARLLEGRYAHCEQVILICDQLNTHTKGAFYEVFEPQRARQLVRRMKFCHTPKHGSWLNIAENELSSLTRQCVSGRRFGTLETLQDETAAWSTDINTTQRGVDWQMKIADARCKLSSVYPKIKL